MNANNRRASYDAKWFDSFGVEYIPKEIKKIIGNKNVITNIYRIQACDLIMCWYSRLELIDLMLKWFYVMLILSFLDYTNLFSPSDYDKIDKIILK